MAEEILDHEGGGFTDEDFDIRYSSPESSVPSAAKSGRPTHTLDPQTNAGGAGKFRSRNSFMRTLLRRRMAQSVPT